MNTPNEKLKSCKNLSFFQKEAEVYIYHDLIGYILKMSRDVYDFLEEFSEGQTVEEARKKFDFIDEEVADFVNTLKDQQCLLPNDMEEEEEMMVEMYPTLAKWILYYKDAAGIVVYQARTAEDEVKRFQLSPPEEEIWLKCDGKITVSDIYMLMKDQFPSLIEARSFVLATIKKWTHSSAQLVKLLEMSITFYDHSHMEIPNYVNSTMPFEHLDPERTEPEKTEFSAVNYYKKLKQSPEVQFDYEETTFSHLFRFPSEALYGKTYGEKFAEALLKQKIIQEGTRILEIGGGLGYLAKGFLKELSATPFFDSIQYTLLELSPILQKAQKKNTKEFKKKITYCQGEALNYDFEGQKYDLVFANEVIADFDVVKIKVEEVHKKFGGKRETEDNSALSEGVQFIEKYGLPVFDAPEYFYLNIGALKFILNLDNLLSEKGWCVLTEYGGMYEYPRNLTHIDHNEFSIHFNMLKKVAAAIHFDSDIGDVLSLIDFNTNIPMLTTTKNYQRLLAAFLTEKGVDFQKRAYTKDDFAKLCEGKVDLHQLKNLHFNLLRDRVMGIMPQAFKVFITWRYQKPALSSVEDAAEKNEPSEVSGHA